MAGHRPATGRAACASRNSARGSEGSDGDRLRGIDRLGVAGRSSLVGPHP